MSFQYPANPEDGTVLIQPQEDGTFLKGTYNINTNTWEVGVLPQEPGVPGPPGPEGPPGEQGEPGRGVEIAGAVDTFDDLPNVSKYKYQFWIVNDTNTLYLSDGTQWLDLGSPIQGPQGESMTSVTGIVDGNTYKVEFKGTIPALDLTTPNLNGQNGAPGTGWYDTIITDDAEGYRITFLSNTPSLEFTTEDLRGPEGSLTVASKDNLGGIKIGRGLDIAPDGTASAGQTDVDIETTPIPPTGVVIAYQPTYVELQCDNELGPGDIKTKENYGAASYPDWCNTVEQKVKMPDSCDAAIVWWRAATVLDVGKTDDITSYSNGQSLSFRCYLTHKFYPGGGAVVESGPFTDRSEKTVNHNWSGVYYDTSSGSGSTVDGKYTSQDFLKVETITFNKGAELSPRMVTDIDDMSTGSVTIGGQRLVILPFKTTDNPDPGSFAAQVGRINKFMAVPETRQSDIPTPAPIDEAQIRTLNGADLKSRTGDALNLITSILATETDEGKIADLNQIRTTIMGVVDLPGTYADLDAVLSAEITKLNTGYLKQAYRFETAPPS